MILAGNTHFCGLEGILAGKRVLAAKHILAGKHILLFGGKTRFCNFSGKTRFVVLAEKRVLWFWRENVFWGFDVKTRFCGFSMKTNFLWF